MRSPFSLIKREMKEYDMALSDPLDAASALVRERFEHAVAAFLGGSALSPQRTTSSDLDIVVIIDEEGAPYRETLRYDGWLCELFVHDATSFDDFTNREIAQRRSPLLQMCADGTILLTRDGIAENYQLLARDKLEDGPPPLSKAESDQLRYALTDLLDDFNDAIDRAEFLYIATQLFVKASELALSSNNQWTGTGKWMARRLAASDPLVLERLSSGYHDAIGTNQRVALRTIVTEILNAAGGPLAEGYHA